jgi:hypothetical protein
LNGSFVYGYTATDNGSLSVDTSLNLVIRSVATDGENTTEYWRVETPLAGENETLAPSETLRVSFTQDVTGIQRQVERIEAELGATPGTVETAFVATVRVDGTRNGQSVGRLRTYRLPVTVDQNVYRVNDSGPVTFGGERTTRQRTEVVVQPGPLRRYGGPLVLAVGLLGVLGLGYGRYTGRIDVSEVERAYLAYRQERAEFDEWITEARVPADRVSEVDSHIETTSLSGLVDLAIDTDSRVVEAAGQDRYYVLGGDTLYSFESPDPEPRADPLDPEEPLDAPESDDSSEDEPTEKQHTDEEPIDFDQFLDGESETTSDGNEQ